MSLQRSLHPDRIPVRVSAGKSAQLALLKSHFLVKRHDNFSALVGAVRRHIHDLKDHEALFFYILEQGDRSRCVLASLGMTMEDIDKQHGSDTSGILQVVVCKETTFGGTEADSERPSGKLVCSKGLPYEQTLSKPPETSSGDPVMRPVIEIRNVTIHKVIPAGLAFYYASAVYWAEVQYSINNQSSVCKEIIDMNESSSLLFKIYELIRHREKIQGLSEWRFSPVTF